MIELAPNSLLTEAELQSRNHFGFAPEDSPDNDDYLLLEEAGKYLYLTDLVAQKCTVRVWVSKSKGRNRLRRKPKEVELVGVLRNEPKILRDRRQWYDYRLRNSDGRIRGGDELADELLCGCVPADRRESEFYRRISRLP